jgi:hypothetical protein
VEARLLPHNLKLWNDQDADGYAKCFHKDLKLKLGPRGKAREFSWDEYAPTIAKRMEKFGPFEIKSGELRSLEGDKARIEVIVMKEARDYPQDFILKRENGEWLVIANDY